MTTSGKGADSEYDVIVVGTGGAGCMAALRATEFGFKVLLLEKGARFGGTSITSGGVIWIPNHGFGNEGETPDSEEESMLYLKSVCDPAAREDKLRSFLRHGRDMMQYVQKLGIKFNYMPWPDYFSEYPGARADRSIVFPKYDGKKLGKWFFVMREQFTRYKMFNRYSMDFEEAGVISTQSPGWIKAFLTVVGRYWLDVSTRLKTKHDSTMVMGGALIAPFAEKLIERGVDIKLDNDTKKFIVEDGKVAGVETEWFGKKITYRARHGVVNCSGGFDWNQKLRDRFMRHPGDLKLPSSPQYMNTGALMEAGMEIGAATEFTETAWMTPIMTLPIQNASNHVENHHATFDVGRPYSVCVNRNGDRFTNESQGYDRFGNAMLADAEKTGANAPCWLVFDAKFRHQFTAGGILPSQIMPDRSIPVEWWDHYIWKADSISELARKIDLDPDKLERVVANMNEYAKNGKDPEFGRGDSPYDNNFGDPKCAPNVNLGPIRKAPFYAIPVNLGELGMKGGLKTDANGQVVDTKDKPIPGLYAAGNASGSPFGNCYPGAGGTIGPGMAFGYAAVNHIAEQARVNRPVDA